MPLTTYWCIEKDCDWQITDHKWRDALKCPECDGLITSKDGKRPKQTN